MVTEQPTTKQERRTKRYIARETVRFSTKLAKLGPGAVIVAVLSPDVPADEHHTYIQTYGNSPRNIRTLEDILRVKLKDGRTLERDYGDEPDDDELDRLNMDAWLEENKKTVDESKIPKGGISDRQRVYSLDELMQGDDEFIRDKIRELEQKKKQETQK